MAIKTRGASGLVGWLSDTQHPLFVIDRRRRVRFFNTGCVALTGCQPADVIGKPCEYVTEPLAPLSQRIRQAIAPPDDVYQGQQLLAPLQFIDAHGKSRKTQVLFLPLPEADGEVGFVLGIVLSLSQPPKQLLPTAVQALHAELSQILHQQAQRYQFDSLVAASLPMKRVASQIALARQAMLPVHITGPQGAGKLYCSQLLCHQPGRDSLPVVMYCGLLPHSEQRRLLKDLLDQDAEPGLPAGLVLKDVDKLSAELQKQLAERLAAGEWPSRLRLVSTSRFDVTAQAASNNFNAQLAFQLTPLTVHMPGLHERGEDLELLIQLFVEQHNPRREQQITAVDRSVLDALVSYGWTDHARELKKLVTESVANCTGPTLQAEHLPFRWKTGVSAQETPPPASEPFRPLQEVLEAAERTEIRRALIAVQYNKARAAELLGMTRAKFYRRLEALDLQVDNGSDHSDAANGDAGPLSGA